MAKRGETARQNVINTITQAFGDCYVGTQDKKIYVNAREGGEEIQFAISITMPKNPIGRTSAFTETPSTPDYSLSEEDRAKINDLKERLGIK
jgi:hypothetical protein